MHQHRELFERIRTRTSMYLPEETYVAVAALVLGVRALCVISAGFAEIGSEGVERQDQLLALVRSYGARLIGPNCLGIAVAEPRLNATFAGRAAPSGNIGFSSQSGALGLALLEAAVTRGLGLSGFVSIGNKADVSTNDLLEWWEDDPRTDVVLLYLESFGNPRRFANLARRVPDEQRREQLREQAERLNPDSWVTDEEVTAGLDAYESVLASLREVAGRRRRRRRGRGASSAANPAVPGSAEAQPGHDDGEGDMDDEGNGAESDPPGGD